MEKLVALFIGLVILLIPVTIYYDIQERKIWTEKVRSGECQVIAKEEGYTYYSSEDGITTPSKTAYKCKDGITYWRND